MFHKYLHGIRAACIPHFVHVVYEIIRYMPEDNSAMQKLYRKGIHGVFGLVADGQLIAR